MIPTNFVTKFKASWGSFEDRDDLTKASVEKRKEMMRSLLAQCQSELETGPVDDEFCKWALHLLGSINRLGHDLAARKMDSLYVDDIVGSESFALVAEKVCQHQRKWKRMSRLLGDVQGCATAIANNPELAEKMKQKRKKLKEDYPESFPKSG